MAKSKSKSAKTERQARIDAIRGRQESAERRRGLMIVGACAVIALLIVGAAAYQPIKDWWDQRQIDSVDLASIGAPASACQDVETKAATGGGDHVEPGTDIPYEDAPPAFGTHYNVWAGMDRKFYTAADRPDVGELVHNLEHGYTILWYDETIADDSEALGQVKALASKLDGDDDNFRNKFKAVPWTSEDGGGFPDGQHIAFTHWSVGGDGDPSGEQTGVWQYCSAPSGEALEQFMKDYPYTDSPEPTVGDM